MTPPFFLGDDCEPTLSGNLQANCEDGKGGAEGLAHRSHPWRKTCISARRERGRRTTRGRSFLRVFYEQFKSKQSHERERAMTSGIGIDKASELAPKDFDRLLLRTLTSMKKGDFQVRMPVEFTGTAGKIADTLNDVLEQNQRMAEEIERISNVVGKEGKLNSRMQTPSGNGSWAVMADSVNALITDLVQPTNEIARVIGAVAKGDLSRTMMIEFDGRPLKGEFLRTAKTVNTMVEQLGSFASEVTRVAREVGTEGKLGGQADVKGVAGTWKDLTDSVNS